jgi:hypothetical protein
MVLARGFLTYGVHSMSEVGQVMVAFFSQVAISVFSSPAGIDDAQSFTWILTDHWCGRSHTVVYAHGIAILRLITEDLKIQTFLKYIL